MGYSNWSAMGRLVKDPETKPGTSMVRFTIAVDRPFSAETDFFDCTAWNKAADRIAEKCNKGVKIIVEGYPITTKWVDKDGKNRKEIRFTVTDFHFCESKKVDSYTATTDIPVNDDDLPF